MPIKDNHIAIAGGIRPAVERVRARCGHMVKVEVEVDTLDQLETALALSVDAVLLDNMSLDMLSQAVGMAAGRVITEASGRVTSDIASECMAGFVGICTHPRYRPGPCLSGPYRPVSGVRQDSRISGIARGSLFCGPAL